MKEGWNVVSNGRIGVVVGLSVIYVFVYVSLISLFDLYYSLIIGRIFLGLYASFLIIC